MTSVDRTLWSRTVGIAGLTAALALGLSGAKPAVAGERTDTDAAISSSLSDGLDAEWQAQSAYNRGPARMPYPGSAPPRALPIKSDRLAFVAGAGFNGPSADSGNDILWGGNVTVGVGYHFNPYLSLLAEYQFLGNGLPNRLINSTGASGGNAHIWGLTLNPKVNLTPSSSNNLYLTGGGGFYRKVTNFTDPAYVLYCNYFYCVTGVKDVVIGHFSSNQGGWSAGAGIERKLAGSRMKLFAEARYLQIETPASAIAPNGLGVAAVGAGTKLVPVTFGVRF